MISRCWLYGVGGGAGPCGVGELAVLEGQRSLSPEVQLAFVGGVSALFLIAVRFSTASRSLLYVSVASLRTSSSTVSTFGSLIDFGTESMTTWGMVPVCCLGRDLLFCQSCKVSLLNFGEG